MNKANTTVVFIEKGKKETISNSQQKILLFLHT